MNDIEERVPLEWLDPETLNPGFWVRFHHRVLGQAQAELSRRRANGDLTIPEVMLAWRKALVPMALLAASLAGIFLMSHDEPMAPLGPVALEEALIEDLEGEPIPTFLGREPELEEVAFLASVGGF